VLLSAVPSRESLTRVRLSTRQVRVSRSAFVVSAVARYGVSEPVVGVLAVDAEDAWLVGRRGELEATR